MIDTLNPLSLRAARENAGLSRFELAAMAKVSETTILRIEKGEVDPKVSGTWAQIVRAVRKGKRK